MRRGNPIFYLPESFEWLILKADIIEDAGIAEMLENPGNHIESRDYFSWERYFTAQLIQCTKDSYLKYAKRDLNPAYLQKKVSEKILKIMKGIDLT